MSFLNELKSHADALQAAKAASKTLAQNDAESRIAATENACSRARNYLGEMVRQLNILVPAGPTFSVDGKTPWPRMKLVDFRADARKKKLGTREVYASIGVGWEVLPLEGEPIVEKLSVNFLPALQKVETSLQEGNIQHERLQLRHPEKGGVQAITFEYHTRAFANIVITPDHDKGTLTFNFCNVTGLAKKTGTWTAETIDTAFLDELAKLVMSQPSRLFPTLD